MLIGSVETTILIVLTVVIFGPVIAERFRIPGIVGLIFGGTLFGPFVLAWLEPEGLVAELGAIGILYLMFLAGATFDLRSFDDNRSSAITYGLLGFFVPFLLTIGVVTSVFGVGLLAGAMMGAMWASNTLVAYPEIQAAGLQKNRAISAAVSAGVVADLLSLTVLAFATATAVIELDPLEETFEREVSEIVRDRIEPTTPDPFLPVWLALPLLVAFCLWLLPLVTRRFFVTVGRSRMQRFVFALVGMSAGATFALLGGIEGLIGAFLAGLGMNRLIPTTGPLMERLEFVGAAIFVPIFLVSIGLNIDPALLIDPETLLLGLVFTSFVVVGKTVSAVITARVFGFSAAETGVMASLSFGQAASTLAIAQVGLSLGMFEQIVVNASVIAIVITALLTSYGTRFFANRVPRTVDEVAPIGSTVLVDVRDRGGDLASMMSFAGALTRADAGLVIPYLVAESGGLGAAEARLTSAGDALAAGGYDADGVVRIAESFEAATVHLEEERGASLLVVPWSGPSFTTDLLIGADVDGIGRRSHVPSMAVRLLRPWERVVVALGDTSRPWRLEDATLALEAARRLMPDGSRLTVVGPDVDAARALLDPDDDDADVVSVGDFSYDSLVPTDLAILPAHVVRDLPPLAALRLGRSVGDLNLAVVAGPHRLFVSTAVTRRAVETALPVNLAVAR